MRKKRPRPEFDKLELLQQENYRRGLHDGLRLCQNIAKSAETLKEVRDWLAEQLK